MSSRSVGDLLAAIGLDPIDSAVYLGLFDHPGAAPDELAVELDLPLGRVRRSVTVLAGMALVDRLSGSSNGYVVVAPDIAIDAAVLRRQQALDELRASARDLVRRMPVVSGAPATDLIEVVADRDVHRVLAELELGARREVMIIDSPPYLGGVLFNTNELQALARGVTYRAIYHAPGLRDPDKLAHLSHYLDAGEQARSLPEARMKMVIVDGETAVIPREFGSENVDERLVVRCPALVRALMLSFEHLWDQATPLRPTSDVAALAHPHARAVLRLMATGAKDTAIARALGVTTRTVVRRIAELTSALNAETRFQAGAEAARRGWI